MIKYFLFGLVIMAFTPELFPLETILGEEVTWLDCESEEDSENEEEEKEETDKNHLKILSHTPSGRKGNLLPAPWWGQCTGQFSHPYLPTVFRPPIPRS